MFLCVRLCLRRVLTSTSGTALCSSYVIWLLRWHLHYHFVSSRLIVPISQLVPCLRPSSCSNVVEPALRWQCTCSEDLWSKCAGFSMSMCQICVCVRVFAVVPQPRFFKFVACGVQPQFVYFIFPHNFTLVVLFLEYSCICCCA